MKKGLLIILTVLVISVGLGGYIAYQKKTNDLKTFENNKIYDIEGDIISVSELATLINKADDMNKANRIDIDEKGYYIENNKDSIKIKITFLSQDLTVDFEKILNNSSILMFIKAYDGAKFKCNKVTYHKSTRKCCIFIL